MTDAESPRRVVVFGVDGVRLDTLRAAHTPTVDAIAEAGFLTPVEVCDSAPTLSGPVWSSVASGVRPAFHNVYGNDFGGHRLGAFRDFLTAARLLDPGLRTYLGVSWAPLATAVFAPATRTLRVDGDAVGHAAADDAIADDAAAALGSGDYAAAFVYLGDPDETAHHLGVGPEYRAAVEAADARLGRVLAAIRARPGFRDEQWTVLVVTDHGHRDGGGHGLRSDAERTAWLAGCGPGLSGEPAGAAHVDVAPTVLAALGLRPYAEFAYAGRPLQAPAPAAG